MNDKFELRGEEGYEIEKRREEVENRKLKLRPNLDIFTARSSSRLFSQSSILVKRPSYSLELNAALVSSQILVQFDFTPLSVTPSISICIRIFWFTNIIASINLGLKLLTKSNILGEFSLSLKVQVGEQAR